MFYICYNRYFYTYLSDICDNITMKKPKEQKLIRRQVSLKLENLRGGLHAIKGIKSWSKYMRHALGMSVTQLARRLAIAQSTTSDLEKREIEGRLTIKKLREVAEAMECDLVYSFVPKKPLEDIVFNQAKIKALKSIEQSDTHMSLEDQKVTSDFNKRLEDLIEDKMYSKYLWDQIE